MSEIIHKPYIRIARENADGDFVCDIQGDEQQLVQMLVIAGQKNHRLFTLMRSALEMRPRYYPPRPMPGNDY